MKQTIFILILFFLNSSCNEKQIESIDQENIINLTTDLSKDDSLFYLNKLSVTGDFDGDNNLDTICQNNISKITNRQIDYFHCSQWDSIEKYFDRIESDVILTIKNREYDTLHLGSGGGLYCLINIGDNNKDKKDEIALVVDYYSFTNISSCNIYTLCNKKWIELKSFKIHEDAFNYYMDDNIPDSKQIKGFLEYRKKKWYYIDYMDWFNAETNKDTILKVLKIKNGC